MGALDEMIARERIKIYSLSRYPGVVAVPQFSGVVPLGR